MVLSFANGWWTRAYLGWVGLGWVVSFFGLEEKLTHPCVLPSFQGPIKVCLTRFLFLERGEGGYLLPEILGCEGLVLWLVLGRLVFMVLFVLEDPGNCSILVSIYFFSLSLFIPKLFLFLFELFGK